MLEPHNGSFLSFFLQVPYIVNPTSEVRVKSKMAYMRPPSHCLLHLQCLTRVGMVGIATVIAACYAMLFPVPRAEDQYRVLL